MNSRDRPPTVAPERLARHFWAVAIVVGLSVVYAVLQIGFVQPYLWPAGHGVTLAGDSRLAGGSNPGHPVVARPPEVSDHPIGATVVMEVVPGSPAARAGLQQGDEILALRRPGADPSLDVTTLAMTDAAEQMRLWRTTYWIGTRGPVELRVQPRGGDVPRGVTLDRPAVWSGAARPGEWARRHLGLMAQIVVFIGAATMLLLLRSSDLTASFCALALALSAVGGGGSPLGTEQILPPGLRELLTLFAWTAAPFAFPFVALAILYFPKKSPLLVRHPWAHAVPFLAAAPMIVVSTLTVLFLVGVDAAEPAAVWDATHAGAYYASFATSLAINVLAVMEGTWRFRSQHDANERRRIRIVLVTAVPGVLAYALKAGLPAVSMLTTGRPIELPWLLVAVLQAIVLLPAFGLTYAVAVHRVLGPRVVLRRSIQYALANRTLTVLAILPGVALVWSLVRQQDMTLAQIVAGAPSFYAALILASIAAFKYRNRARTWLDQRFFREEYDARKILLSLASQLRFETDPSDLSAMVVNQIDEALHPQMAAILASEIDEGFLTPVTVLHGSAESLPLEGPLVTMLRWSDEPLEIYLDDPRSPARRLPPDERDWLECTGARLLVPVLGQDRALVAMIVLGDKRSEEPYTAEDRQLLASIAAQMDLGLDVARLRRRVRIDSDRTGATTRLEEVTPLAECPQCGRCEDATASVCPIDGTPLTRVPSIPREIDHKYRVDQLLGRGGMGAVYRAHDMRLDRDVAIKIVRAELLGDPEARKRFRREAQIVARLQHPGIVSIFDYGTLPSGGAYLVMELVRGEDLRRALQRDGRFAPDRARRLLAAICSAIEAAHREGVLHRDLKPENILLTGGDVEVKVLDFGVAKLIEQDAHETRANGTMLTVEGSVLGTPAYMAPEQLRGQPLDARTDVFSLGVIAFEVLTGVLPFGRGSLADIALQQMKEAPPMAGMGVPAEIEHAVRAAVQVNPAARPASPAAFAALLQPVPAAQARPQ